MARQLYALRLNGFQLTPSPGNLFESLRSPDTTFAEIAALDVPESVVYLAVQAVESCCTRYPRGQIFQVGSAANTARQFTYTHTKPRQIPTLRLHVSMLKLFPSAVFDKLALLLQDFSSIVSRIDETATAMYERMQGECGSRSILTIYILITYLQKTKGLLSLHGCQIFHTAVTMTLLRKAGLQALGSGFFSGRSLNIGSSQRSPRFCGCMEFVSLNLHSYYSRVPTNTSLFSRCREDQACVSAK